MNAKSTSQKEGLWTMGKGQFEESVRNIERAIAEQGGEPCQFFERFLTDKNYTSRVAEFMLRGGIEASIHQKLAQAILGKNFFGVKAWSALYGVNFSRRQLREIAEFPWDENVLNTHCPFVKNKTIRETHFAFLGLSAIRGKKLSIMKLQKLHPSSGQPKFYFSDNPCYKDEEFATQKTCGLRWYLMLREIVPGSENKTYEEQLVMLPPEYEVPFAIEETTKDITCFKKNGTYLNPNRWGRCQDISSDGGRVRVGGFGRAGLFVDDDWGGGRSSFIGLSASRKFPES